MVVVRVGKKRRVDGGKVNTQRLGVFQKHGVGTHVKKKLVLCRFDVERQTVFALEVVAADGVFKQGGDFHLTASP